MCRLAARSLLVLTLVASVACSSGVGGAPERGRLARVNVDVFGWNAFVKATIIDREGRRTGWNVDRPIREIPGCLHEYGSEEGIPNEDAPEDTTSQAPADTVPGGPQPTPMYHYFTIADSADVPGLIHEGGCELRLDPEVGGKVQLALLANGAGLKECKDTTSVWAKPGIRTRWRLSWKTDGRKCYVSISQVTRERTTKRPRIR
jgi:hypothetical protein